MNWNLEHTWSLELNNKKVKWNRKTERKKKEATTDAAVTFECNLSDHFYHCYYFVSIDDMECDSISIE